MKSTINFIIGGVDVSEYAERENYTVSKVWKTADSFTNYDGTVITNRNGWNYNIKASFENIPDKLMYQLTAVLDSDNIPITFTDPHSKSEDMCTTDTFMRGESTGGTVACELDDGLRWNLSISLDSVFHSPEFPAGDGGGGL